MRTDGSSASWEESDEGKGRSRTREEAMARVDVDKKNLKSTSLSCLDSNMSRAQPPFRRRGLFFHTFRTKTFEKKKREGEVLACLPDNSRESGAARPYVNH